MSYPIGSSDQRSQPRALVELPATISVGSQITVKGYLKDLALNSAFVRIKSNIYLQSNDEIGIVIECVVNDTSMKIEGKARISRIVPGEGLAVYFTEIDEESLKCIKKILQKTEI